MLEPSSPLPSTFDEFEQQQRSFDNFEAFAQMLAEQAASYVKEFPGTRIVGMIVESGAAEAAVLRRAFGAADTGQDGGFVGVVPRQFALGIIGEHASVEHEAMQDDVSGPRRRLPVLFVAATGFRWLQAQYEVDEPSS